MSGKNDPRSEKCGIWTRGEWENLTRTERPEGDSNKNNSNSNDNPKGGRRK